MDGVMLTRLIGCWWRQTVRFSGRNLPSELQAPSSGHLMQGRDKLGAWIQRARFTL